MSDVNCEVRVTPAYLLYTQLPIQQSIQYPFVVNISHAGSNHATGLLCVQCEYYYYSFILI
jgi:hypothetical protein